MKKLFNVLVCLLIVTLMAGCSGGSEGNNGGGNGNSPKGPVKVIDDVDLMKLHITVMDNISEVERYCNYDSTGKLLEKDIIYTIDENNKFYYAYVNIEGMNTDEMFDLSVFEQREIDGRTFYTYQSDKTCAAMTFDDDNEMYAGYCNSEDETLFDKVLDAMSFTDNTNVITDDDDLGPINYSIEGLGNVYEKEIDLAENVEGEILSKKVWYHFGQDRSEEDYTFSVRRYCNTTLEEQLNPESEYIEEEVNGNTYTIYNSDLGKYSYYIQYGDDVFQIYNSGDTTSWLIATRSDESHEAFAKLIESVTFE